MGSAIAGLLGFIIGMITAWAIKLCQEDRSVLASISPPRPASIYPHLHWTADQYNWVCVDCGEKLPDSSFASKPDPATCKHPVKMCPPNTWPQVWTCTTCGKVVP